MDFSAAAIAKARQFGTGLPLARFEVVDATQPVDLGRAFDVLLDLGCLHQLPPNALPQYRANLERWSRPGTRLLALMKTYDDSPQETLERALALLQPGFKLLSFVETDLAAVDDDRSRPGVCLRLERV
jgi:SAM-dependent methyltransferase